MRHKLAELIDVEKTRHILERFSDAVGIPAAIIGPQGKVLIAARWQRICTDFHREHPTACKRCIESDTILANEMMHGKDFSLYSCKNGLTVAAAPIIIENEHLANAFLCQFLTGEPDLDFFSRQADEYGFVKSAYFQALSEVPVVAQDTLSPILSFLSSFSEMLANMGLKQLQQLETKKQLQRARDKLQIQNEELIADITKRKKMEDELRRAKQEWERTFDSVPDLIAILDPQHRIVRANREMARRIGLEPEGCTGMRCHECVHKTQLAPEICPHERTLADGLEHVAEVHDEHLGGHFLVSTTPLRDEDGAIVGTVHVARDITERKLMEEELRKSHDELEARVNERTADLARAVARLELINQELQEFAFVASHDLQEPLRKIQSFCDLVLRSNMDRVDEKGKDHLTRIQQAAKRMQQLLKDLLNYSRVASQPEPFRPADMKAIIEEAAEVFEHKLREIGGKIEISEMPVIEADSSQMTRLFQNLIGNAVKYAGPQSLHIRIYSDRTVSFHRFFVEDNGIGFDEKYLDRIFSPFQRLHGSTKYSGTGMGLAICRKITERHSGGITAKSTQGKGSTFIVSLPVKQ